MTKPTLFARALVVFVCGILMAFFGCAGFLNFETGSSGPLGARLLSTGGAVMFGFGVLATVVGGVLIIGLAFWALVNVLNNWIGG